MNIPIISLKFLLSIFLTTKAANGAERATPIDNGTENNQSMVLFTNPYNSRATMHENPSAKDIIPIALLASMPAKIWPEVTNGPYPPPLRPLLKAAKDPRKTSLIHENTYFLFRVIKTIPPAIANNIPMYAFRKGVGSTPEIITAIADPNILKVASMTTTLKWLLPIDRLTFLNR